jgi:hypothetical protein
MHYTPIMSHPLFNNNGARGERNVDEKLKKNEKSKNSHCRRQKGQGKGESRTALEYPMTNKEWRMLKGNLVPWWLRTRFEKTNPIYFVLSAA